MFLGTGIGGNAPGRNGAMSQCPQEFPVPEFTQVRRCLDIREGASNPLVGFINGVINRRTVFCLELILGFPDVLGCCLQWNICDAGGYCF